MEKKMTENTPEAGSLSVGTYWQHKRLDKQARIARVWGDDVQVIDDSKGKIRWLSIKGFLRDYHGIPAPQHPTSPGPTRNTDEPDKKMSDLTDDMRQSVQMLAELHDEDASHALASMLAEAWDRGRAVTDNSGTWSEASRSGNRTFMPTPNPYR